MTKADLGGIVSKGPMESEKEKNRRIAEREMRDERIKKRIHRVTCVVTMALAIFVCFLSAQRYFCWMVQTVIDRTDVHISEIPFPAVTLCPVLDVYDLINPLRNDERIKINAFLHNLEEVTPKDDDNIDFNDQGFAALQFIDDDDLLNKMSFKCEDFFAECTWRRIKRNCCSMFRPSPMGRKMCYVFNSLVVENPDPTWPWSENASGRRSGLRVVMKANASQSMIPRVMAMIHYPEDQFSSSTLYLSGEVHITLDALKFYADTTIGQLGAEYRRCYFTDEIVKYKKSSCQCYKDCRIAYLERVCNCTPRGLVPKELARKEFCTPANLPCTFKHRGIFFSNGNIYEKNVEEDTIEFVDCKCFPNCNYVQYKTFIRYDLDSKTRIENNSEINLDIYFLRDTIFGYRTAMVYSMLDFFVAICSIIALFLGVSFISVVTAIQNHFAERRKARERAKDALNK